MRAVWTLVAVLALIPTQDVRMLGHRGSLANTLLARTEPSTGADHWKGVSAVGLTIKEAIDLIKGFRPWGESLVEVFRGRTYALQQTWMRDGKKIKQAVPAVWFHRHRRIETEADFLPFTAKIAAQHLLGYGPDRWSNWDHFKVGIYPMLPGNVVLFTAADFDIHQEKGESDEAFAARRAAGFPNLLRMACGIPAVARRYGVSVFIEISASGSGIHIWLFFSEPIPAGKARRLLWRLLCAAGVGKKILKGFKGKAKFDALFPRQDMVRNLSPGNLIYLPYYEYGLRIQPFVHRVEAKSIIIDADIIHEHGFIDGTTPPLLSLSDFLKRLVRHTPDEVDAALEALAVDGHDAEPPDVRAIKSRTAARQRGSASGIPYSSNVDWREFLRASGIAFDEPREGILRLTDSCPACGIAQHSAWINANTGWLNCFSSNCAAHSASGGMSPWKWLAYFGLKPPREMTSSW